MTHISFSELKSWQTCPFYHKITYIDGFKQFQGNEHTAFGTAMHNVCEKVILKTDPKSDPRELFEQAFEEEMDSLPDSVVIKEGVVEQMRSQGRELAPLAIPALTECFGDFTYVSVEEELYENIEDVEQEYKFKGYVDLVIKTPDGKYHIIDWKTCSWGWDSKRKNDKMTTYQLSLYKHFWAQKHAVPLEKIETHFALLKRTAKNNKVEIFRVTSGKRKLQNSINLLMKAIYNITSENYIKNKMSCKTPWGYCEFYKTEHCP